MPVQCSYNSTHLSTCIEQQYPYNTHCCRIQLYLTPVSTYTVQLHLYSPQYL